MRERQPPSPLSLTLSGACTASSRCCSADAALDASNLQRPLYESSTDFQTGNPTSLSWKKSWFSSLVFVKTSDPLWPVPSHSKCPHSPPPSGVTCHDKGPKVQVWAGGGPCPACCGQTSFPKPPATLLAPQEACTSLPPPIAPGANPPTQALCSRQQVPHGPSCRQWEWGMPHLCPC